MNKFKIISFLILTSFSSFSFASNDLDKWNSEKGKVIRSELKSKLTTTYKEKPNPLHTDSTYKAADNGGKVLTKLETKAEIKGSRVGATIEALKQVDKAAVAKKWAKEFAKGGVRFAAGAVLIEVAMNEMLNGIGWIMDEGGKIQKPNPELQTQTTVQPYHQYRWVDTTCSGSTKYFVTPEQVVSYQNSCGYYTYTSTGFVYSATNSLTQRCNRVITSSGAGSVDVQCGYRQSNPSYNPSAVNPTSPTVSVPVSDVETGITDYLNTSPNTSKDLLIEDALKPKGKASIMWSDDPSSEQTIFQDNKDAAERILNSDNPQGEGLTKTTPKIDDGTTVDADTTPKPNPETPYKTDPTTGQPVLDPTTGQPVPNPNYNPNADTGSTTSFSLPAFCSWASVVCDWLDWTKENPDTPDEDPLEPQELDIGSLDTSTFQATAGCPADIQVPVSFGGASKSIAISYEPICALAQKWSFIAPLIGFISGAMILIGVGRKGEDGDS